MALKTRAFQTALSKLHQAGIATMDHQEHVSTLLNEVVRQELGLPRKTSEVNGFKLILDDESLSLKS